MLGLLVLPDYIDIDRPPGRYFHRGDPVFSVSAWSDRGMASHPPLKINTLQGLPYRQAPDGGYSPGCACAAAE